MTCCSPAVRSVVTLTEPQNTPQRIEVTTLGAVKVLNMIQYRTFVVLVPEDKLQCYCGDLVWRHLSGSYFVVAQLQNLNVHCCRLLVVGRFG